MTPLVPTTSSTPPAPAGGVLVPDRSSVHLARSRAVRSTTLLAGLLILIAGTALVALYKRYLNIEIRGRTISETVPYGQSLGATMAHQEAILRRFEDFLAVQAHTRADPGALERYAAELRRTNRGIRAIEVAHEGRIVVVAPLLGNEAALGLDLRGHPDPEVRAKLAIAESTNVVTITGPSELAQGGIALVLRRRFTGPRGGHDIAAIVVDMPTILEESGLLAPAEVRIAVRDSYGKLLFGAPEVQAEDPIAVEVRLPDATWRVEAVPRTGWSAATRTRLAFFFLGVLFTGSLLLVVVYLTASRQAQLVAAVEARTGSLREAVEQLQLAAEERERTEAQLRQSQRLESLGRLAGGIAHDFNNLLTVILGSISLARTGLPEDGEASIDLAAAEDASRRATKLTRKLLTFARRQSVEAQVLDLNGVLEELQVILRRLIGERVTLVEDLAPGLWPIFADPGQIEQVVTNLALNGRDAMPDGGTLTIRTRNIGLSAGQQATEMLEPGEYVRLEVEDTGTGMTPEVLQRVFEPFYSTKEIGHGTGLGLATVYGIVQQGGGDIQLQSVVGRGSKATLLLPRSAMVPVPRVELAKRAEHSGQTGETILLVEDEAPVRQIASRILGDAGYRVIAAEEGDSALRRLDPSQRIHLLVADVVTPGLGGRALAERILQRDANTKILFISGYIADERLEELLARPGVRFLAKPFTGAELQGAVRQLLDTSPPG